MSGVTLVRAGRKLYCSGGRGITIFVHMARRRDTLAELLREMPVSVRQLARASDLTHVALLRARDGQMRLSDAAADETARREPPRSGG